ncbi:MAG: DUF2079 domain-containing protein [Deltaproteobacteria bacterium]|jgi:uncharacterized membrane protein
MSSVDAPSGEPDDAARPRWIEQLFGASVGLVALGFLGVLAASMLPRRASLAAYGAVAALDTLKLKDVAIPWLVTLGVLVLMAGARHRGLRSPRAAAACVGLLLFSALTAFASHIGHHGAIVAVALVVGVAVGAQADVDATNGRSSRHTWWVLWLLVAVVHAIFSMHRHWAFGSGSWDHGCMVHNFYRAAHFLDTTSTVLGDVDFLGDHFMLGIYLYAPIVWMDSSGYMVLAVQAINVGAAAPAIYLIARHHGARPLSAVVIGVVTGLSFGLQSASFFDSHEITVGIGFLAFGLWAIETERYRLATLFLVLFATFKESLGAYVVALGLLMLWRAARSRRWRPAKFGAGWIVFGAVWFVLVNRVFMPTLIARANAPEPHETFGDFGPTVFAAAIGIVTHPMKAFLALFVPAEKLASHAVTFGGVGWLALLAPEIGIAALPLFAERFLSSKGTMWEMGYHYAAPLCLYAGWATAVAWPRIVPMFDAALDRVRLAGRGSTVATAYVLTAAILVTQYGYRHPANYYRWREGYFSKPARRTANAHAVALVASEGREARVAVQNRILPHLADRPVVYRLGEWKKADWVVLSVGESAWPYDAGLPQRLARQLSRDQAWRLVFSETGTAVFARVSVTERPAVEPHADLGVSRP